MKGKLTQEVFQARGRSNMKGVNNLFSPRANKSNKI
jgi:hypothetical protein